MNFAINPFHRRILVWLMWCFTLLAFILSLSKGGCQAVDPPPLLGVVTYDRRDGPLFPWQGRYRGKKWALVKYRAWRRAYQRVRQAAMLARLALREALSMAQVVDWLTLRQVKYQLGALPVLYALLETLPVSQIINRHCSTRAEVDQGTVARVLILNRLMFPLPLYQVADWVGQTVLVAVLGIPANKFNDDRLGRALDRLYPHLEQIWLAVVEQAICKATINLSLIFYD